MNWFSRFLVIGAIVGAGIGGSFATGMLGGGGGSGQGATWRYITWTPGGSWASETGGSDAPEVIEFGSDEVLYGIPCDAGEFFQVSLPGVPEAYAEGTPIYVSVWQLATAGTGNNTWKIQAQAYGDGDGASGTWGSAVSIVDTIAATDTLYKSAESTAITIANSPQPGDFWQFRGELDVEASTTTYFMGCRIKYHATY